MNIEASDPQHPPLLQQWIVSEDGKQAVTNMVKCLGLALRGEQWNHVSFSPHSVVCPLYNLTRCFPACDLCLDHFELVSYISQLIRESQRFSHWKENMNVAIKIFEHFASSPVHLLGACLRLCCPSYYNLWGHIVLHAMRWCKNRMCLSDHR